jgi:uncharacterized protein YdaU (DUF1376 family)
MNQPEKVDAWMPLWIGAYLADTMHLTRDQHGGYLLLLFAYWRNKGPLIDDAEELSSIAKATPAEWKKLGPRLARFFTVAEGYWTHNRADKELETAGIRKANATSKAKAAADARWGKSKGQPSKHAPSMPQALPEDVLDDCPTPSPINTSSDDEVSLPTPGDACKAMKAAGMALVSPSNPSLIALLEAGITVDELADAAADAVKRGKPFAYALVVAENRRREAAAIKPLPAAGAAPRNGTHKYAAAAAGIFGNPQHQQGEVIDV